MNTKSSLPNWLSGLLGQLVPNLGSVLIMAAVLFVYNARAASLNAATSPSTISYQGTLTDAGGTPVNATVGLTVSLYNVQSGGTPLWTEAHTGANAVPINNGAFNMRLGGITPIPSSVWDNPVVYLGIKVEGDSMELSPREVVDAVPYAMNASGSFTIPDGSVTTAKIADGAVTKAKLGTDVNLVSIQSGEYGAYWDLEPGWTLHTGSGVYVKHIIFPQAFQNLPKVFVSLNSFDVPSTASSLVVGAQNITTTGFDIRFQSWNSTNAWSIGVSWLAYAPQ